jgi:hypothetical protein
MDLPKFTRDLNMTDRIEKVAKNGVRAYMHVGSLVLTLEIFKFPDRVLLGHDVFDLQLINPKFSIVADRRSLVFPWYPIGCLSKYPSRGN